MSRGRRAASNAVITSFAHHVNPVTRHRPVSPSTAAAVPPVHLRVNDIVAADTLPIDKLQFGRDDSTFNMILCSCSFCQLQQVFLEYHRLTGRDFEDVINSEFIVNIRAVVKSVRDKITYLANRLMFASTPCFGSDDRPLICIIATRYEIKNAYMSMYRSSLKADIGDNTYCEYKRCLKALVLG